jgi:hypothetical protein
MPGQSFVALVTLELDVGRSETIGGLDDTFARTGTVDSLGIA